MKKDSSLLSSSQVFRSDIVELMEAMGKVMFGKYHVIKLLLISLICHDHILLEDVPGTGKTLLINTLAKILGLKFKRIQGTPDLLPGDVTGVNVFDQAEKKFHFVPGPIFANILLFDEINRASPKTQSALLEAMAEAQVSIDNETYKLESPFIVIATQNPVEHLGTYPLPQAQLDRFLIKTKIGYPSRADQKQIMLQTEDSIQEMELPSLPKKTLTTWHKEYKSVFIDEELIEKLLDIVEKTHDQSSFALGMSPRSSRQLIRALQASAYIHGRDFVNKDDMYDLFLPVMAHRVFAHQRGQEEVLLQDLLVKAGI